MIGNTIVKSLSPVEEVDLMDLSVDTDHTYIAQGLVTHNTFNFSILYGAGPRRLSAVSGVSEMEAKRMLTTFFQGLPTLKRWIDGVIRQSRKSKRISTIFGRTRPLNMFYDSGDRGLEAHGDRCVPNTHIQGSCADIMKTAMARVHNWIYTNNYQDDIRILLTMHDELVFEIREDMLDFYIPNLNQIMILKDVLQDVFHWPVPLKVDAEYGDSWHCDHDYFEEHPEAQTAPTPEFHRVAPVIVETPVAVESQQVSIVGTAVASPDVPVRSDSTSILPEVWADEFVYVLKARTQSTIHRLNMILTFLQDPGAFMPSEPKAKLILKDSEGNSFLIDDVKINPWKFLSLAQFLGI
jgi:hypothetical protein